MSERKVLNKYYPPDFDPSKIPKLRLAKERQYTVRIMAPFNMQCKVCGEYIYKGKKFNAKTENIHNENYLGLRKYRFYIRCPKCIGEIVFKTDPENEDYSLEQGAVRLFEAVKLYREAEEKEKRQAEEDAHNPMKLLENRTKDSKLEMEVMENLEELRELNMRKAVINYEEILKRGAEEEAQKLRMQEEEDEAEIKRLFGGPGEDGIIIKRLADDDDDNDDVSEGAVGTSNPLTATNRHKRPTDVLTDDSSTPPFVKKKKLAEATTKSSSKARLSSLVKVKNSNRNTNPTNLSSESEIVSTGTNMDGPVSDTEQKIQKSISEKIVAVQRSDSVSHSAKVANTPEAKDSAGTASVVAEDAESVAISIQEGLSKQKVGSQRVEREKSSGLSLLGGYDFSDSEISDSGSDS